MSIKVNNIDDRGIKKRLGLSSSPECKEALQLIKCLEDALKRQQELTALAISKLKKEIKEPNY